jgi:opacity protein-like surface antigen
MTKPFTCATVGLLMVVWMCVDPSVAWAQGRPSRPFRGLFGSNTASGASQTLTASFAVFAGQNGASSTSTSIEPGEDVTAGPLESSATFGAWSGLISYDLGTRRLTLTSSASVSSRYTPDPSLQFPVSRQATVGARWQLLRHTFVNVTAQTARQPVSTLAMFPGATDTALDPVLYESAAFGSLENYASDGVSILIDQSFSQRSSLVVSYGYAQDGFSSVGRVRTAHAGSLGFSHRLTRSLSVHLGYQGSFGRYLAESGETRQFRNDSVNAGVDYAGSLTLSRRTTLSFRTGSTVVTDHLVRHFWIIGNATLRRELGRTWDASVSYDRQAGFIHTIVEPVFTDSVNASLTGLLGRRVQVQSSAGAITGSVGVGDDDRRYIAYQAGAGLSTAFSRYVAVRVDCTYYQYQSHGDPLQLIGTPRLSGRSISIGANIFAPLFTRVSRRGNAAR